MEEWNRIDLHQHTLNEITFDGKTPKSNYSHREFYKLLWHQDVKLKAVTNHNSINIEDHIKHYLIADMLGIQYLSGVEIDYIFSKRRFQAISILSDDNDIIRYSEALETIIQKKKGGNIFLDIEEFSEIHKATEFIFIPHAIKENGIFNEELDKLDDKNVYWIVETLKSGSGVTVLFENTKDFHIYSLAKKIQNFVKTNDLILSAYVGTDYKFDNDEDRKKKIEEKPKYCINANPSYRGLEISVLNYDRISEESNIVNRSNYIKKIKFLKSKYFVENQEILLSSGLNVIIGNSGTGKTMLLQQIYKKLTGKNLSTTIKSSKSKIPYKQFLGNSTKIEFELIKKENIEINTIEIPNLFSEIIKSTGDRNQLLKIFDLDDTTLVDSILEGYKSSIQKYIYHINIYKTNIMDGEKSFGNIIRSIQFIEDNLKTNMSFSIFPEYYNSEKIETVNKKVDKLKEYISKRGSLKKYILEISKTIDEDTSELILNMFKLLDTLFDKLIIQLDLENKKIVQMMFQERIIGAINKQLKITTKKLNNKEKAILDRKEVYKIELTSMVKSVKNYYENTYIASMYDLEYPLNSIKDDIEKRKNEYARVIIDNQSINIKNLSLVESSLINSNKIKTILNKNIYRNIDFRSSKIIKRIISYLLDEDINFADILSDADNIEVTLQLFDKEESSWKNIEEINQGTIAKISMDYYFNKKVKSQQPNIILVDQPENDVDKEFLTKSLSGFIRTSKQISQIIVTSHDAIIAINSDANRVIEAAIDRSNRFNYESFPLEQVDKKYYYGTDKVAKVLDGGKHNIKIRYKVYGGSLRDENENL